MSSRVSDDLLMLGQSPAVGETRPIGDGKKAFKVLVKLAAFGDQRRNWLMHIFERPIGSITSETGS